MKQVQYSQERDFVKNANIFHVVEYLYDHRLQPKNEICFIQRVLEFVSRRSNRDYNTLEYQTLLFYISKYGLCSKTQALLLRFVGIYGDELIRKEACFQDIVNTLIREFACRKNFCDEGLVLLERLQHLGFVPKSLCVCSSEEQERFNRKYIREYVGYIRFIGLCLVD